MRMSLENVKWRGSRRTAVFAGLFVLTFILFSTVTFSVGAQGNPTATPQPTVNPTIAALENVIATQRVKIDTLERELGFEAKEREIGLRDINSQWKIAVAIVGIAGVILAVFGFRSLRDVWNAIEKARNDWKENVRNLETEWEQRSKAALDIAVYKLDLGKLPIYLPLDEDVSRIHRLLKLRKFEKVIYYKKFEEFTHGILIVSLKGKDERQQGETFTAFKKFMEARNPSAEESGFILYCPDRITAPPDVMSCHDNLVTANYPATVVSSIFTVGRGIEITAPQPN
jgi:hypothetical protein